MNTFIPRAMLLHSEVLACFQSDRSEFMIHVPLPIHTRTHTHTHAHTHTRTHTHMHAHTHTHAYTHARTHARIHTHTRTHAHTHAHTASKASSTCVFTVIRLIQMSSVKQSSVPLNENSEQSMVWSVNECFVKICSCSLSVNMRRGVSLYFGSLEKWMF